MESRSKPPLTPEQRKLIEDNCHRVLIIASKFRKRLPSQVEFDELVGWGNLRLVECALRFQSDHEGGASFATFANHNIAGAMFDFLRSCDLSTRHERRTMGDDAPRRYKVTVASLRYLGKHDGALDAVTRSRDIATLMTRAELTPRMLAVIERLLQDQSQAEIAIEIGVCPGRVSQIQTDAIAKMRAAA